MSWVFREDTFDPVTRTRRGRLYEAEPTQPAPYRVLPDPYEDPFGLSVGAGGRTSKTLYAYKACASLLQEPQRGMGLKLALGTRGAASAWRIIQTEVVASGCVMVTLKSLSAFGILPAIDLAKVPAEFKQASRGRSSACSTQRSGRLRSRHRSLPERHGGAAVALAGRPGA
jgi:hypothetical protein